MQTTEKKTYKGSSTWCNFTPQHFTDPFSHPQTLQAAHHTKYKMAQTMLLTSGVSANQFLRNKNPLAQPKVHHFFLSGNSHVVLPSRRPSLVPLAIFKPKTKAAPKKVEKVKPKVEDGIFGTSGGIGFTKQNELFVGRVAMIE
ncbi:hypothetical protein BRARA_J00627 [Brassica rapa]|uniref:Uncharacterized protein n=1 Tax=Brassica campestris TaxID=3711 RepID=A0A397XIL9_BRACM|nr:hypothetical protein BRARA_J00627 [Brassica rapa]